jgi:SH3-like domain-containing protein
MVTNWIDPWDSTLTGSDGGLWVMANTEDDMVKPVSAVVAFPPLTRFICQTPAGNNIRSGPGVSYDIVTKSSADIAYEVFQVQVVTGGDVPGEWYQMRWDEGRMSGWIWSGLMSDCRDVSSAGE